MAEDNFHNVLGGNSADQLRAYVACVERIEGEIEVQTQVERNNGLKRIIQVFLQDTYDHSGMSERH